jgi:hypothetical protein
MVFGWLFCPSRKHGINLFSKTNNRSLALFTVKLSPSRKVQRRDGLSAPTTASRLKTKRRRKRSEGRRPLVGIGSGVPFYGKGIIQVVVCAYSPMSTLAGEAANPAGTPSTLSPLGHGCPRASACATRLNEIKTSQPKWLGLVNWPA